MLSAAQLQLLSEIARTGSLASAARALGQTPPAVSQAVTRMESAAGATLVERGARGARLTRLGALLATEGDAVGAAVRRADEQAATFLGAHANRLRVGALSSTIRPVVADALAHLRLRHPGAALSVVEIGSQDGVQRVRDGALDLAVVATYGLHVPAWSDLRVHELAVDPLLLVVPDDHRLSGETAPVALARLTGEMWAGGAPGEPHRLQQDELLSRRTALPEVPFETASYEVALALVSAGVAVALVPTSACHHLDGAVALALEDGPHRVLHAVSPTSTDHLTLIAPMIAALASTAAERVTAAPRDGQSRR